MDAVLCTYCESLEVLDRSRRGAKQRCPLCKSEIFKCEAGASYRIPPSGVPVAHHRAGLWITAALGLVALVGIAIVMLPKNHPTAAMPALRQPVKAISEVQSPVAAPTIANADEKAVVKGGVGVLIGVANKPAPQLVRLLAKGIDGNARAWQPPAEIVHIPPPQPTVTLPRLDVNETPSAVASLAKVPELKVAEFSVISKSEMKGLAKTILDTNGAERDSAIKRLKDNRRDLAGLPFVMGDACRLDKTAGKNLAADSLAAHNVVDVLDGESYPYRTKPSANDFAKVMENAVEAEPALSANGTKLRTAASWASRLPAFDQILAPEAPGFRVALIDLVKDDSAPSVAKFLVRRAVFETSKNVREAAVKGLAKHSKEAYTDELLAAFRYPWSPAAVHAAQAVVALERIDLIGRLDDLRNEPAPDSPVKAPKGDAFQTRELVRVNHHKNCFLCHAPATKEDVAAVIRARRGPIDFPIGLVPDPSSTIRSFNGRMYYRGRQDDVFVRADVTYLRQDFSVMMRVANPGPWPDMQRFDFLVRTNTLTANEAAALPRRTIDSTDAGEAISAAIARLAEKRAETRR